VDGARAALWGESFAPPNPEAFTDPLIGEEAPAAQSEPLGGLLALLGGLYEEDVRACLARGTLAGYAAVLRDRYCYVPHDAVVPGALTAGDLDQVAAALAPRPLRLEGLVDGRNVRMRSEESRERFAVARDAYLRTPGRFEINEQPTPDAPGWLVEALR